MEDTVFRGAENRVELEKRVFLDLRWRGVSQDSLN